MGEPTISARIAELPATLTGTGEDRVRIGHNAVIVLDGASGTDSEVTVGTYVDHLADSLIDTLDSNPTAPLTEALSSAIASTVAALDLQPGRAPCSTVSIVRRTPTAVDILVLADSPVYVAHHGRTDRLSDDRLGRLDLPSRRLLLERLAAGCGYDDHQLKELARRMPREKAPYRNRPGGYWIAEADPRAGAHALTYSYLAHEVSWGVMLTDGADDPASHLAITAENLATMDESRLRDTLYQMHRWESDTDPDAKRLPRFKRHDDKTIAVVRFT